MSIMGTRVKELRLKHKINPRQLEIAAAIPHGVLSRLERDHRAWTSIPAAIRLAKVLDVSLDYLCGVADR